MLRRLMLSIFAAALLIVAGTAHAAQPPEEAAAPVDRLTATLLETMQQADELGFEGRYDKLEPVLRETFDFAFMARLSVGRHWGDLTAEERDALVERFAELSIATFASRFDGYSGQTFEVLEPREGPRDSVLVPTRLNRPADSPVNIDYLTRRIDDEWRAVDIYLGSRYSELATKRSEYSSVMQRQGFAALINRIESSIAELRKG